MMPHYLLACRKRARPGCPASQGRPLRLVMCTQEENQQRAARHLWHALEIYTRVLEKDTGTESYLYFPPRPSVTHRRPEERCGLGKATGCSPHSLPFRRRQAAE